MGMKVRKEKITGPRSPRSFRQGTRSQVWKTQWLGWGQDFWELGERAKELISSSWAPRWPTDTRPSAYYAVL